MSDKDFIDKLNDIIVNYGYIMIDRANYEYYFDRYNIKNYYKEYLDDGYFQRFQLFNVKENMVEFGFTTVDMMIHSNWGLFELIKRDIYRIDKYFPIGFDNFIMSIEGDSKEEICLKIQMMGY